VRKYQVVRTRVAASYQFTRQFPHVLIRRHFHGITAEAPRPVIPYAEGSAWFLLNDLDDSSNGDASHAVALGVETDMRAARFDKRFQKQG
jgi:hypothetical protein